MDRRNFLAASAAASLAGGAALAEDEVQNQYYEIRDYQLRNSKNGQMRRLGEFFEQEHLPMTKRIGTPAAGYFSVMLGEDTPRIITLTAYDSLAHMQEMLAAKSADEEWMKASDDFGASDQPAFDRVESRLLRAFDGMKKIEPPPTDSEKSHLFDLRLYQAETFRDTREKVKMFNTEEIAIFRKTGINPLLFGETVIGSKMPNLTYMVWYDDMAARDKAWQAFLSDPDWIRIRSKPGWGNDDIVSHVSNTHLTPLPFSPIR